MSANGNLSIIRSARLDTSEDTHLSADHLCWLPHRQSAPARSDVKAVHLTPRQSEVLALLCEGLPNKLICRRLGISAGTVKIHIANILRAFGVTSRLQAVVLAQRSGRYEISRHASEPSACSKH